MTRNREDRMRKAILTAAAFLIVASAVSPPIQAGNTPAARDSLCILFTSGSPDMLVQLRRGALLSSTVPATICELEPGVRYRFGVRGRGYEPRWGYLSIDDSGMPSVRGNRLGTFARNIVPGWGSISADRKVAGWTDISDITIGLFFYYREAREYQHIENRLTILNGQLEAAENVEDRQSIRLDANRASRDLNVQNAHRNRILIYTGYMYAFQLIDPWLIGNPPGASVSDDGRIVEVSGSGMSTLKASLLSLFRPGRGQFYQGKWKRGGIFSVATTIAVYISLDYLNQYEQAVNLYELQVEYFNTAETVGERQALSSRADEFWADVEKTRRWRDISYGVLAGIWAVGLIDTFIPGREDAPLTDLSLDAGPNHVSLVYRF
jgi:hypothetical protein